FCRAIARPIASTVGAYAADASGGSTPLCWERCAMANDFQEFGQWFQDLATRSMADQMRAAQRYTELMQRFGRGELFPPAVRDEYLRFVRDEAARYARNLATLSVSYYNALDALGRAYNDRFFDQVLGVTPTPGAQTAAPEPTARAVAAPRQVELALHAAIGED